MTSYANELPTCMFMASELQEDGRLKSWKEFSPNEIKERASKNSPQEDSNFRCLLSNLGLSKEELVIYNFKLNLLQQEI